MTTYNGHKNWNYWNVSLWIANDEGLYREALSLVRQRKTKEAAAHDMLRGLNEAGITKTADGAPYSVSAIRAAMVGLT